MDIENELEKLYFIIANHRRFQIRHWNRSKKIRAELQRLWKSTDLTAGEICDGLDIETDDLSEALDVSWEQLRAERRKRSCWELNSEAELPLFIPIRITQLKEAIGYVEF